MRLYSWFGAFNHRCPPLRVHVNPRSFFVLLFVLYRIAPSLVRFACCKKRKILFSTVRDLIVKVATFVMVRTSSIVSIDSSG